MNEIYIVDGVKYNVGPNKKEEFLKKFPNAQLDQPAPGKTQPTTQKGAEPVDVMQAPELTITESPSVDTSLELPEQPQTGTVEVDKKEIKDFSLDSQKTDKEEKGFLSSLLSTYSLIAPKIDAKIKAVKEGAGIFVMDAFDIDENISRKERVKKLNDFFEAIDPYDNNVVGGLPGLGVYENTSTYKQATQYIKDEEAKQMKTNHQSFTKAALAGDLKEASFLASKGIIETLPSLAFSSLGAPAMTLHGVLYAGEKFMDEYENNPKSSLTAITANALGTGAIQSLSDYAIGKILKIGNVTGAKAAKDIIKETGSQVAKKYVGRFIGEGGTEVGQGILNKALDNATLDKNLSLFNPFEIADEFLLGGIVSSGVTVGQYASGVNAEQRAYAEGVLMPESAKAAIDNYSKQYSALGKQYSQADNEIVAQELKKGMDDIFSKVSTLRRKYKTALYAMDSNQLSEYADNINRINKIQKGLEKTTSEDGKKILYRQINDLNQSNKEILKDAITSFYESNVETAANEAKEAGVEFEKFTSPEEYQEFIQNNTGSKKLFSGTDGVLYEDKDGKLTIAINETVAKETGAVAVGSHELLHAVLYKTLKGSDKSAINLGDALAEQLSKVDIEAVKNSDLQNRLKNYLGSEQAVVNEELLTLFSDALATGDIKLNSGIITDISDGVRRVLQNAGFKNIKFDSGKDVLNFIKDYNKSISKGKLRRCF